MFLFLEIIVDQINGEGEGEVFLCPLSRSAVHLVSRVPSLGFSFLRFHRWALGEPFDR